MSSETELAGRRLIGALDEEVRHRGHGSIRTLERTLGYSEGWWQHRVAAGSLSVSQLLAVANHLGLDAVGLIRRVLARHPDFELDRPRGEAPELVRRALARAGTRAEPQGLASTYLDNLDRHKRVDSTGTLDQVAWAVERADRRQLARLLSVAGFAWRRLLLAEEAEHSVYAAIHLAQQGRDTLLAAKLLRQMSDLMNDRDEATRALTLVERAAALFLRCGAWDQLVRTSVKQALTLQYLGRYGEALGALKGCRESVAGSDARLSFSAHQVLGLTHCHLGSLDQAETFLELAAISASHLDPLEQGQVGLVRGAVALRSGGFQRANSLLWSAARKFRGRHPHLEALAMTGLFQLRLLQGQPEDADLIETSIRASLETSRHPERICSTVRRNQKIFGLTKHRAPQLVA